MAGGEDAEGGADDLQTAGLVVLRSLRLTEGRLEVLNKVGKEGGTLAC